MQKLARVLGMLAIVVAFSGCGNKTAITPTTPVTPTKSPEANATPIAPVENPTATSEMPQVNSSNPVVTDLNNLANDIDGIDKSAQGLDENEDLSAE